MNVTSSFQATRLLQEGYKTLYTTVVSSFIETLNQENPNIQVKLDEWQAETDNSKRYIMSGNQTFAVMVHGSKGYLAMNGKFGTPQHIWFPTIAVTNDVGGRTFFRFVKELSLNADYTTKQLVVELLDLHKKWARKLELAKLKNNKVDLL